MSVRVGAAQIKPILGNLNKNRERIKKLAELGYKNELDLLVFPELANSGYNFANREEAWKFSEVIPEGETVKLLEKLSKEYSMYLISGINERHEDKLYNSAIITGPEGFIGVYRKVHLFMNEKDIFERGREFNVFETKFAKVGIMICFDWIFPEAARTLALKGAEIICHPANLVLPYWQRLCGLRALENRVYIITANRVGVERNLSFTGRSIIVDPRGEIIAEASRTHEELIYADIDVTLARDKSITPRNNIFEDRSPETYALH